MRKAPLCVEEIRNDQGKQESREDTLWLLHPKRRQALLQLSLLLNACEGVVHRLARELQHVCLCECNRVVWVNFRIITCYDSVRYKVQSTASHARSSMSAHLKLRYEFRAALSKDLNIQEAMLIMNQNLDQKPNLLANAK